jgi:phage major head subunit gpT-like protein
MGAEVLTSRAIIGMFYEQLEGLTKAGWVDRLSMLFASDQDVEVYKWIGMVPAMREWIGGRQPKGLRDNGIEIENRHFEATLEFLVKHLRRDKTAQTRVRIGELARRSQTHWASLLTTLIELGETALCYDGQAFFDTDHSEGDSGQQSNDLSGGVFDVTSPTAPTANELAIAIVTMIQQFFTFQDDQGEPYNEDANEFVVMVPVPFYASAVTAVKANTLDTGAGTRDNPLKDNDFNVSLVVNPRLTWTTKLAAFRSDGMTKPFIRQQEEETLPTLKAIAEGSELEFNEDVHHYGIDTWRNGGYGMWQHAVLATLS